MQTDTQDYPTTTVLPSSSNLPTESESFSVAQLPNHEPMTEPITIDSRKWTKDANSSVQQQSNTSESHRPRSPQDSLDVATEMKMEEAEISSLAHNLSIIEESDKKSKEPLDSESVKEKISLIRKLSSIRAQQLFRSMNDHDSKSPDALRTRDEISHVFQLEKEHIESLPIHESDQIVRAVIATRVAELAKMEIELQIRWKEKEVWDLHIETSEEKDAHLVILDELKHHTLKQSIAELLDILLKEETLLRDEYQVIDWSERFGYVYGRRAEMTEYLARLENETAVRTLEVDFQ